MIRRDEREGRERRIKRRLSKQRTFLTIVILLVVFLTSACAYFVSVPGDGMDETEDPVTDTEIEEGQDPEDSKTPEEPAEPEEKEGAEGTEGSGGGEDQELGQNMEDLRLSFFDLARDYRFDFLPVFEEGAAPTDSQPYLYYAFVLKLGQWGEQKGTMDKTYVDQVALDYFGQENLDHGPLERNWDYDGQTYQARPAGVKEAPLYWLKEYRVRQRQGQTVYEIRADEMSLDKKLATKEEIEAARAAIARNQADHLTIRQKEVFIYSLDDQGRPYFRAHLVLGEED